MINTIKVIIQIIRIRSLTRDRKYGRVGRLWAERSYSNKVIRNLKNLQNLQCEAIICYSPSIFYGKAIKWLKKKKVSDSQIILYGESLGTGVAVEIGAKNNFNSIILESPFTSIENSAKIYYPYLPVRFLLKDRYDSISKIKKINSPILIMHGKKDDIVPFFMGKKLFEKANSPKDSYFTDIDDHMMEFNSQLLNKIKDFITKY